MVTRTYYGLGPPDIAAQAFDRLKPWVVELLGLQGECKSMGTDYTAMGVALDGLQTAAFHLTHRPHFYFQLERPAYREGNNRLADREAAGGVRRADPRGRSRRGMSLRQQLQQVTNWRTTPDAVPTFGDHQSQPRYLAAGNGPTGRASLRQADRR
jgi:hypothetical protein